jgi:hypothetical protein
VYIKRGSALLIGAAVLPLIGGSTTDAGNTLQRLPKVSPAFLGRMFEKRDPARIFTPGQTH